MTRRSRLPHGERALVDIAKLRDYYLNPHHEDKHKARVFSSALGLSRTEAEWLRDRLLEAAATQPAVRTVETKYGSLYVVDFLLTTTSGSAVVRSGWIIRFSEEFPRLATCFVKRSAAV